MTAFKIVDVADLTPVDAPFVDLDEVAGRRVVWSRHSGLPHNAIERRIQRPRLSRYRAAYRAVREATGADAIVSHLPRMSAAVADIGRFTSRSPPHLAFSFNFTELPSATQRKRMTAAFARIDQFCVYSRFEAGLYADAFAIDPARLKPLVWTQSVPAIDPDAYELPDRPYVVAVGGEGRDFATLIAAARQLPDLHFLIIARPRADLIEVPSNVALRFDISAIECWTLASGAAALLVPLLGPETCCGHITLVSGRLLGLPIITTASRGTADYTEGFAGTVLIPAQDATALAGAIQGLFDNAATAQALADADRLTAKTLYDRRRWSEYIATWVAAAAD